MKLPVRLLLLLLAWIALGRKEAWAQCTQTTTLNYVTAADGDRRAVAETAGGTVLTTSNYTTTVAGSTNVFTVGTTNLLPSKALVWQQNTQGATGAVAGQGTAPATVTYTFSRAVTNLQMVLADIDRDDVNHYIDQVAFDGYANATDATPITLVAGNVALGGSSQFVAGSNAVRGTAVSNANAADNVTVTFPSPVTKLVLRYSNLFAYAVGDSRLQTLGINSISFCSQADVYAQFTAGPTTATTGQSVTYTAQFGNNGPDIAATTVTRQVTVPTGAIITNAGGGTISGNTINFGNVASLASGASNSFTYTYTLPSTTGSYNNVATITAGTSTTAYDPAANNSATRSVQVAAGAGACNTATVNLDYRTRTAPEVWKAKVNEPLPSATSATRISTVYSSPQAASEFELNIQSTIQTLRWQVTHPSAAQKSSTVTYTFSRPVSNFTVRVMDIDGGTGFVDQVRFSGANGGAAVTPTLVKVVPNSPFFTINGTAATANPAAGNTQEPDIAAVVASFPNPITTLTLVYSNEDVSGAAFGQQAVGIDLMTWCQLAPVAVDVATAVMPNTAGQTNISPLSATGDGSAIQTYTIINLPPAGAGQLYYNASATATPNYQLAAAGQTLTPAQAASLRFDPAAGFSGVATFTYSATDSQDVGSNTATYSIPVGTTITGNVFEDVNYGGGAGRPVGTVATSGRANAIVELYDASGNYVTSVATSSTGQYTFPNVLPGGYAVRVVNASVTSSRNTTNAAGLVPVQTYVNGNGNRVGGEAPEKQDAAANTTNQTLAQLSAGTLVPQSLANVTVATTGAAVNNVDFGFNFDVVTNTNDSGQGSLRQFITNANALGGEATLAQSGSNSVGALLSGKETSIFMIPSGAAVAGLRAGLTSGLTNGVAVISPATALPAISGPSTSIDGSTQTFNIGNTNNVALGAGGTVGTGSTALSQVNGPEVQLVGSTALATGLNIATAGTGTTIIGLAVYGFGSNGDSNTNGNIVSSANNVAISRSVVGSTATSFTNPALPNTGSNIRIVGGTGVSVTNNLIGFSTNSGIFINQAVTGTSIANNEIRGNARVATNFDGIDARGSNLTVTGNLFAANAGQGYDSFSSAGSNNITSNTFTGNGVGNATSAPTETAAIRILGTGNTVSQNVINDNYGAGVQVQNSATVVITQNSISGNGTIVSANNTAASNQIGIDLTNSGSNAGTAPYVTVNDSGDGDTGANGLLNYPVLATARIVGTDLVLEGFARPGSKIELFAAGPTADASGFGEGRTYLTAFTEGNTNAANGLVDNNASTGSYGPGNVNGLNQGTDDTNRFSFTIPLSSLPGGGLPSGTVLTSTATLNNGTSEFSGNIGLNADVTTTITGPNALAAGQTSGTFTATYSNVGNASAAAVDQKVVLPVGATITSAQLAVIQAAYPGAAYSGGNGGTLTFAQAATLAAGASNVFQFAFTAPVASGAASIASNVATTAAQGPNAAPDAASFALTVTAVADVAATITGSAPTTVPAGTPGTFNVSFANLAATGPQTATGVTATVQLPAGLDTGLTTGLVTASNGGVYNNATGLVSYSGLMTLTSGQTVASVITYTQPAQGNVTGTAAINTATNQAGQTANDTQVATNVGSSGFDLATTLSGPTSAVAGTLVTYAVTTANIGSGSAPNAVQTVSIPTPTALTNVFLTNGGTYSFSNGTSLFTFPTISALGSGQRVNNSISFTSPASGPSALAVTALVTPNTPTAGDASTDNNQISIGTNLTTAPAAVGNTANVYVTIASDAPTSGVAPNASVTFTVKQGNNGPNPATTVATQVYLPTGLSGVVVKDKNGTTLPNSATSGYNTANGVVIFPTETSEASAIAPLTYTIQVTAPASGVITATAAVSAGTNDPVAADNVALTAVTVNQPVLGDVATALSGPANATPGEILVYTVSSTNKGTTPATGVEQTVQLPAGLTGVEVRDANGNLIANSATLGYNSVTGLVTFASAATLGSSASLVRTISFPAPDNSGSATGGSFVPVASVSSTSADVVLTNNKASVTTTVSPTSDFAVALSGPATTVAGNPVTYTITTTNNGASVGGQQTTVQLPAGLNAAGAGLVLPAGAAYDNATGVLTLAAVPAQGLGLAQARTSSVTFNMPAGVVVLAPTAQVTPAANTNDANSANNAATATTTVTPATEAVIDLATTVTADQPSRLPGQAVIFTVTSLNNTAGNSATGVVQQLALVPGLVGTRIDGVNPTSTTNGISLYPGGATYNANTGIVTFPPVTVTNGTSVVRTVRVAAPGEGPLVATASIQGSQSEVVTANNTANAPVTILPRADVLTATTGPATTQPNAPVSYSLTTTNNGPSAAANVVPTLTLPAGFSNVVLPSGASLAGNTVTFATVGSLASGQTTTNTVTFTSPATTGTYAVNGASTSTTVGATPATVDPAAGNNNSSASTTSTAPTATPVAFNVVNKTTYNATNGTVNSPSGNTAGANLLLPFSAAASTGQTISTYTVTSLPTTAQGTLLYFNGTAYQAVTLNKELTPTEASTLKFDPADDATTTASVGNVTFSYVATDNLGKVSNTALYTIQVADDNNSVYTATPNKGGVNQYQTNDVLAFVTDSNGAAYNGSGLVYNPSGTTANILAAGGSNGLTNQPNSVVQAPSGQGPAASGLYPANPTNVLPAGVSLNTTTGLIFVSNRSLLVNNSTVQYYQINVITTDIYGGTNVVPAQFTIGAYPLPVELATFTAAAAKLDAQLKWTTASEKNNDRFEVERSLNGTDYVQIGQVKGQGNTSAATSYALTDKGIGAKASGPVYYRLKQVDADGTASFSPVRAVTFAKEVAVVPAIRVFPNPATTWNMTMLDLTTLPTGSYQVSLLDATGRVVLSATRQAGLAEKLDLNTIASGTYTVLVRGQNNGQVVNLTTRLVKE